MWHWIISEVCLSNVMILFAVASDSSALPMVRRTGRCFNARTGMLLPWGAPFVQQPAQASAQRTHRSAFAWIAEAAEEPTHTAEPIACRTGKEPGSSKNHER